MSDDVKARNEELAANLKAFNLAFEEERRARLEREKAILDKLSAEEHISLARYEEERAAREQVDTKWSPLFHSRVYLALTSCLHMQVYMAAKARLEDSVQLRTKRDEKFQVGDSQSFF